MCFIGVFLDEIAPLPTNRSSLFIFVGLSPSGGQSGGLWWGVLAQTAVGGMSLCARCKTFRQPVFRKVLCW